MVAQFRDAFSWKKRQTEKLNILFEKFRTDNFTELDVRFVQHLETIPEADLMGMQRNSARTAFDRFFSTYGPLDLVDEDPMVSFTVLLDSVEDMTHNDDSEFGINERFEFLEALTRMVDRRDVKGLVVTGQGGLGKSYTVFDTLGRDRQDVSVVKGYASARALFDTLQESPKSLHIFDDCDSVLEDKDAVNLLKGAIDTEDTIISWRTAKGGETESFRFEGRCIFISNKELSDVPQPILSRCHFVDVNMTTDEKIARIKHISADLDIGTNKTQTREVFKLIEGMKYEIQDLNIRTFMKSCAIRQSGEKRWAEISKYQLKTRVGGFE